MSEKISVNECDERKSHLICGSKNLHCSEYQRMYRNVVLEDNDKESIRSVAENIAADLAANREKLKMMTERHNKYFLHNVMRDD